MQQFLGSILQYVGSGALSKTRTDKWIFDSQLHACSDVSQRE